MVSRTDLDLLEGWEAEPAETRLASFIASRLQGKDYAERLEALTAAMNYSNPASVRLWLDHKSRIPLRKLPEIAKFLEVDLSVLAAMWIASDAPEHLGHVFYEAVRPKATSRELALIEKAKETFVDDEEDLAEDHLIEDLRQE